MSSLASRIERYLHDTLGVPASRPKPWHGKDDLPYFLGDAFALYQCTILGSPVLLAVDTLPGKFSVGQIRDRLEKIHSLASLPVVYATEALASYERKRLIEQKIPFVVPGNQLYLPDAGIDLREYFRKRAGTHQKSFSPSAQALLIAALLRKDWQPAWQPAEVAARLGYTPMTVSRAVRELVASGVANAQRSGRRQYLEMPYTPRDAWERAGPLRRSPVQRRGWIEARHRTEPAKRSAGLSALARQSMLDDPPIPVYAMSLAEWKVRQAELDIAREPSPGSQEWQLWNYSPAIVSDSGLVDPLSLLLSLKDHGDERIQSALDELKEQLPW